MLYEVITPSRLVSLNAIEEIRQIRASEGGGVVLGAGVTLDRLRDDGSIRQGYPALVQAIEGIRGEQIVSRATLGGNRNNFV